MDIVLHNCIIPSIFYGIYTMLSEVDYSLLNLIENAKQTPRSYTLYKILYSLDIDMLGNFATHSRNVETSLIYKNC